MISEKKLNRCIFGIRLEATRKLRRMTQQQLADKIDVGRSQIASIETGRSSTSIDRLVELAKALKVRPATLLKGLDI